VWQDETTKLFGKLIYMRRSVRRCSVAVERLIPEALEN
jgi:hypothetical protein